MSYSKGCKNTTVAMNGYINFQFRRMMAAEVSDYLEHFFETDERPTRVDVFLEPMGNDSGDESGTKKSRGYRKTNSLSPMQGIHHSQMLKMQRGIA